MRRRISVAIIGTVVATLLIAGLGTILLARIGAREHATNELRAQMAAISDAAEAGAFADLAGRPPPVLRAFGRVLRLDGAELLVVGPGGRIISGSLPPGVTADDLDRDRLAAGDTVTGRHGNLIFAAGAFRQRNTTVVIVLTRNAGIELGTAVRWFVLAAVITMALGVGVAARLSKRLTEPLRQADAASRRIADGDLSVRLPDPPADADDELADLARSINSMAEALDRARGLEQQFLLSVSHDLRTPLTSIQGYAEAIADGTVADQPRAAGVILSEARRLNRLVADLLALAKLDARQFSLDIQPVDVGEVVAGAVDGFAPEAQASGITLHVSDGGNVVANADVDRLAQIVANLIENGLRFASSEIRTAVIATDGSARITVDDDGPGIDADDLPHVFERLYVAHARPRRAESGSGLGLAIVRELTVAMGGSVSAEPSRGGGARLVVNLPLS